MELQFVKLRLIAKLQIIIIININAQFPRFQEVGVPEAGMEKWNVGQKYSMSHTYIYSLFQSHKIFTEKKVPAHIFCWELYALGVMLRQLLVGETSHLTETLSVVSLGRGASITTPGWGKFARLNLLLKPIQLTLLFLLFVIILKDINLLGDTT